MGISGRFGVYELPSPHSLLSKGEISEGDRWLQDSQSIRPLKIHPQSKLLQADSENKPAVRSAF